MSVVENISMYTHESKDNSKYTMYLNLNSMLNSHLCKYESVNVLLVMTVHDSGDWYGYLMSTQTIADSM